MVQLPLDLKECRGLGICYKLKIQMNRIENLFFSDFLLILLKNFVLACGKRGWRWMTYWCISIYPLSPYLFLSLTFILQISHSYLVVDLNGAVLWWGLVVFFCYCFAFFCKELWEIAFQYSYWSFTLIYVGPPEFGLPWWCVKPLPFFNYYFIPFWILWFLFLDGIE